MAELSPGAAAEHGLAVWFDGPIAHLQLARPEKLNAIDTGILQALPRVAKRVRQNPQIRAVVLSAQGREFSAGIDIGDVFGKPEKISAVMVNRLATSMPTSCANAALRRAPFVLPASAWQNRGCPVTPCRAKLVDRLAPQKKAMGLRR